MSVVESAESHGPMDAVAIGETLAAFVRADAPDRYLVAAVGAESNVAAGMAQLGCRSRWVSRLGDDQLGWFVCDSLTEHGVEVSVDWDPVHPTGILVKELGSQSTRVRYYRSQSAARLLGVDDARKLGSARWLHVTGVTAALSPSAAELVSSLLARTCGESTRVSFDVNYRPALWPDEERARTTLVSLARQADVVFIGDDEASVLLGSVDSEDIALRLLSREDQEIVIKRGGGAASVVGTSGEVSEPALETDIVDVVGAGDAFAAGYLTGACWGWQPRDRLRLGHFLAARVLGVKGDLAPSLSGAEREGLRSLQTLETTQDRMT